MPAGHDRFPAHLVEEHLGPLRDALGDVATTTFMALGRVNPHDPDEEFCMTVLALKACRRANAVSSLHGQVSRAMWRALYPGAREEQCRSATSPTASTSARWLAPQMRLVYDRHLGADWLERAGDPTLWDEIDGVDDGELWETHQTLKARLIDDRPPPRGAAGRAPRRVGRGRSPSCGAPSAPTP